MKKVVFYMMLLVMSIGYAYAQGKADIKFEQTPTTSAHSPKTVLWSATPLSLRT